MGWLVIIGLCLSAGICSGLFVLTCMWAGVKIEYWRKHKKEAEWRKWKDEI